MSMPAMQSRSRAFYESGLNLGRLGSFLALMPQQKFYAYHLFFPVSVLLKEFQALVLFTN